MKRPKGYHAPYQGFNSDPRDGAGTRIGTGTVDPKISTISPSAPDLSSFFAESLFCSSPSEPAAGGNSVIGTNTPHSQLRQFSFGSFLTRSWTTLPLFFLSVDIHYTKGVVIDLPCALRQVCATHVCPACTVGATG